MAEMQERPWRLEWTPVFVLFLAYVFMILTFRIPGATVTMAAALLSLALMRNTFLAPSFLWLFAAWLIWAGLGYAVTPYRDQVWGSLIEHAKILLVTVVAVNALRTPAQIRAFMVFVLVSFILFPIRSTLTNYLLGYTVQGRAVGPFIYQNSNDLAAHAILVLGLALALWAGPSRKGPVRWIGLGSTALLIITIVLTQSRGGFLALLGIGLPSGISLARRRPRLVPLYVAIVGVALVVAPAGLWERMAGLTKATNVETIREMDPEGSAEQRFAVLQTAARIVADHPILGVGLGAYAYANADYSPDLGRRDTHNTYMNVAAETGVPGLVLFLALLASVLLSARAARRSAGPGAAALAEELRWLQYSVTGYLVAALFGSYARLTVSYLFLALLWSAARVTSEVSLATEPDDSAISGWDRRDVRPAPST
jgi:putative inorganic carbon (HCO3(-)) transporter